MVDPRVSQMLKLDLAFMFTYLVLPKHLFDTVKGIAGFKLSK